MLFVFVTCCSRSSDYLAVCRVIVSICLCSRM